MSNKKKNMNKIFDRFDDESDIVDAITGGDMKQYETYQAFDVDDKVLKLEKTAKSYILSIAATYLELEAISNEDYIQAVAEIESSNLIVLMKQVKYSEHILDSLMRQLDAGGYIDPEIYNTIRQMQKSAIQITIEVSRYVRTLPDYFKFLKTEITQTKVGLHTVEQGAIAKQLEMNSSSSDTSTTTFSRSNPVMGTRELMMHIADSKATLKEALSKIDTIEPIPILVDEDGIHTSDEYNHEDYDNNDDE